jgi:hypothetical protein
MSKSILTKTDEHYRTMIRKIVQKYKEIPPIPKPRLKREEPKDFFRVRSTLFLPDLLQTLEAVKQDIELKREKWRALKKDVDESLEKIAKGRRNSLQIEVLLVQNRSETRRKESEVLKGEILRERSQRMMRFQLAKGVLS